ncbi:MAG: transposase, partial [Proteobacteria bacterium]|nr:transposase [Pseudomonadota bacterium]
MEIKVVEHIIEKKICPRCRRKNKSHFPENVEQPTQYGPGIKSLITYLNQYQLLPYNRLSEFFEDVFGHHLSQGTLVKTVKQCFSRLSMVEKTIKQLLQSAECLHSDETSLRVMKKLYWCHVASTTYLTSYGVHAKRGTEAIEAMDILPAYKGTLIHDHF